MESVWGEVREAVGKCWGRCGQVCWGVGGLGEVREDVARGVGKC